MNDSGFLLRWYALAARIKDYSPSRFQEAINRFLDNELHHGKVQKYEEIQVRL